MNIVELISALSVAIATIVTILSLLCKVLISPIKKVIAQIQQHDLRVEELNVKIDKIDQIRAYDNMYDNQVRQLILESLITILGVLEDSNTHPDIIDIKKRLISFLSKQVYYKVG